MVEEGSWGLLFPKNRVYRVISFESVKYMLTTADDGERTRKDAPHPAWCSLCHGRDRCDLEFFDDTDVYPLGCRLRHIG